MASIFSALNIGYSGLNAAQIGIDTTGNNITNASTPGYTRQRVVTTPAISNTVASLSVGNGTDVQSIARIFDQFVYSNYTSASADKSYSTLLQSNLKQLSTYFPSLSSTGTSSGIKADLNQYFSLWQSLADNPDNSATKTSLAAQTKTLASDIQSAQTQVKGLQSSLNDQLKTNVDEVNTIAKQIASLNKEISKAEAGGANQANNLRDQRDHLALSLSQLVGAKVMPGGIAANTPVSSDIATKTGDYSISVGGFNIVDGASSHALGIDNSKSASGMYNIYYERQDGVKLPIANDITNGSVGAILKLRGSTLDSTTGIPTNGIIQETSNQLDAFAKGLIEQTNNLYAQSPVTTMQSNNLNIDPTSSLVNSNLNIKQGSFDLLLYNHDGDVVAKRAIKIDANTTLTGGTDSIKAQIEAAVDDNHDNNANDNINNFLTVNYNASSSTQSFSIGFKNSSSISQGYSFAISDNLSSNNEFNSGTNFAGALGMNRFLDGDSASNISLASKYETNPTTISANTTPVSGNNQTAANMVQMQFETNDYKINNGSNTYNDTVNGMYNNIVTGVGAQAQAAITTSSSVDAKYSAVQQQYNSVSGVNTDEEMTNLIQYQTSYGAAAKIITTVDQMMTTLLGIKQ